MKTFDQLTNSQKKLAIASAKEVITDLWQEGFLELGNETDLSDRHLDHLANAAAEGSFYSNCGNAVLNGGQQ